MEQAAGQGAVQQREQGWWDKVLTGSSSSLALAFLCNKALFPVRTPITLALTPAVARCALGAAGLAVGLLETSCGVLHSRPNSQHVIDTMLKLFPVQDTAPPRGEGALPLSPLCIGSGRVSLVVTFTVLVKRFPCHRTLADACGQA